MTVGQLEQLLKHYPRETKILILATTDNTDYPNMGIDIAKLVATFVRPDFETVPSSLSLVPMKPLRVWNELLPNVPDREAGVASCDEVETREAGREE
jgi:hypothetical protein